MRTQAIKEVWRNAARYSGLDVAYVESPAASNAVVHVARRGDVAAVAETYGNRIPGRSKNAIGLAWNDTRSDGSIARSVIVVNRGLDGGSMRRTVAHEVMHALGFPGHPGSRVSSVLGSRPLRVTADFALRDKLLIRTLYDPRLRQGDDPKALRAAARIVLAELLDALESGAPAEDVLRHPNAPPEK